MKNKTFFSIIFILLIIILSKAVIFSQKYKSDEYQKEYLLFVESKKKQTDNMVSYNVFLGESFNDKFILRIYKGEEIDISEYAHLKYGNIIRIKGKIVIPEDMNNPGEFNYKNYLYSNNIYGEILVNEIAGIEEGSLKLKEKIISYIYSYKEYIGSVLERHMDYEKSQVAKSIIYGETNGLDEEIKEGFEQVGVSHLMAISGANIASLVMVISILCSLIKLKNKLSRIPLILIVFAFVFLTGNSLSTLRAGIMSVTAIFAKTFNKKIHPLKSLLISLLIVLIYSPFSIYNIGAVLSFLATLGIILFSESLTNISKRLIERIKIKGLKKLTAYILNGLWLTISVQSMILPVQINSFNLIPLTSIFSNVCLSLISSVITILGTIFILFSYIPILNFLLVKAIQVCITVLLLLINILKKISINIQVMDLPLGITIMYYVIVFTFWLRIYLKRYIKTKNNKIDRKTWKKYSLVQIILIVITLISLVLYNYYFIYVDSFIYFFNVGQGEMSYIKCGKNSVIVDIGSLKTNLAYNTISNYFKMKNITEVNAIILSHMHTDHINGLEKYLQNYKVGMILYSKPPEETELYIKFKEIIEKYDLSFKEVVAGEIYSFGDIQIDILLPSEQLLEVDDNINANSLICKITVKDKSIMYMGDGTKETEEKILKLYNLEDVDILKVGHHGSKTSTSEEYIKRILPEYAVISAKKSYYNHPHESVLETLKKYNVKIYITEKTGAIKFNMYNL